jgi:hypothetical protein
MAYLDSNADSANRAFLNEYDEVKDLSSTGKSVYQSLTPLLAKLLADFS